MAERKFARIVVEEKIDGIATTVTGDSEKIQALLLELLKKLYAKNPEVLTGLLNKGLKIGIAKGMLSLISKAISEPKNY